MSYRRLIIIILAILSVLGQHGTTEVNGQLLGAVVRGPQPLLVIAVEFADLKHSSSRDLDYIRNLVFGTVSSYFSEASYNQTWLVGKTTDRWYTLSQNASFYAARKLPWCQRSNWGAMVKEATRLASAVETLSKYRFVIISHPASWDYACGLGDNTTSTGTSSHSSRSHSIVHSKFTNHHDPATDFLRNG